MDGQQCAISRFLAVAVRLSLILAGTLMKSILVFMHKYQLTARKAAYPFRFQTRMTYRAGNKTTVHHEMRLHSSVTSLSRMLEAQGTNNLKLLAREGLFTTSKESTAILH